MNPSAIGNRKSEIRSAFTLIELLTVLAAVVILMGIMISLAQYVRERSARQFTAELLGQIDQLVRQYANRTGDYPLAAALVPGGEPTDEASLHQNALENNRQLLRTLRYEASAAQVLDGLPIAYYDQVSVRDAWGSPIVFMPPRAANIGLAPQDRAFVFSAGPDRQYGTTADNLYSYDLAPPGGGQDE